MNNLELLIDIVLHPRRYDYIINTPLEFDAAEYLYTNHFEELSQRVITAVETVLERSSKYVRV